MTKPSRSERIALVQRIMDAEGTEVEQDEILELLKASVFHPRVSDLIYYPENGEPTAEKVVDEALNYRLI